jgi:hypothetical protein
LGYSGEADLTLYQRQAPFTITAVNRGTGWLAVIPPNLPIGGLKPALASGGVPSYSEIALVAAAGIALVTAAGTALLALRPAPSAAIHPELVP